MKNLLAIIVFCSMVVACHPSLKIKKTETAISRVDTAVVTVITDSSGIDSMKLIKEVYQKVLANKIDFNTFSAKVKVDYQSKDAAQDATAYIRIQKDSLIWMSLRGALGIEGARVLISKDSVIILNTLKKEVSKKSILYLQQITRLPFDFYTLQDLVIGNPVFIDSNITAYHTEANNQLLVTMLGSFFENTVTLSNPDYKIVNTILRDRNAADERSCNIVFSDYDASAGVPFSTRRSMNIAGGSDQNNLNINLDYKSFAFNQPVTFPFNVTSEYKQVP